MTKSKILTSLFAAILFIFSAYTVVFASEINVAVNGEIINFTNQPPIIDNGRTLVPVRGVFEALGFNVNWNQETQTAIISNTSNQIEITIGQNTFTSNGRQISLDVPAQNINGSTMVPIRLPLESVGQTVGWNESNQTVLIPAQLEIIQNTNAISVTNAHLLFHLTNPFVQTDGLFRLIYGPNEGGGFGFPAGTTITSSNPEFISIEYGEHIAQWQLRVNAPGTTTITINDPTRRQTATATVTASPLQRVVARANELGVSVELATLTEQEINRLLPYAKPVMHTAFDTPHPQRRMTDNEITAWIAEYSAKGGVAHQELQLYALINNFRAENGMMPLSFCPQLSMASRLHGQLLQQGFGRAHNDDFYGGPAERAQIFNRNIGGGENIALGSSTPEGAVRGWDNSPGHRRNMLGTTYRSIGVGIVGFTYTTKFGGEALVDN